MDQSGLATMEGGMRIWHFVLAVIAVIALVPWFFPEVADRTIQEGICPIWSSEVCEQQQEGSNAQDDQNVPPWERDGHRPVTPASSLPRTEPTSPQVTPAAEQRTEQPELVPANAPVSEGGVDPWGRHYDALVEVTTPSQVHTCGFVLVTRGFSRRTPQTVIQSFSNAIIIRVCSVPRDQRIFPQGEVCEATPNWHEGAPYRREACYTFTPWANRTP